MQQFGRLIKAGVKLAGGSDCGWGQYAFGDFQGELLAMADAGLTNMQAILAGTSNPGHALRLNGATGTIEQGKDADLLLVDGDPAKDLESLRNVSAVFRCGRRVALDPKPV